MCLFFDKFSCLPLAPRLLGEPCNAAALTRHYRRAGGEPAAMDLQAEGSAIYVLVVASLYLVMVVVMVATNYRMKERTPRPRAERRVEEEEEVGSLVTAAEGRTVTRVEAAAGGARGAQV